jgi:hypothetical protein
MHARGLTWPEIGTALGRTAGAVQARRHALREIRQGRVSADADEELSEYVAETSSDDEDPMGD